MTCHPRRELEMFNFPRRHSSISSDLLHSTLYCDQTFYKAFEKDLKRAEREIIIESPFIAVKRTDELLPLFKKMTQKGIHVRINTRNPNHHDKDLRIQAWVSIKKLREIGVKVKTYDDMRHRKLAVIDSVILWEGSLNIMSQCYSKELMRRTKSATLAEQVLKLTGMNRWSW